MKVAKVGVQIVEETEKGAPYKIWMADRLCCTGCRYTVFLISPNQQPIAHHHDRDFMVKFNNSEMSFV